MDLRARSFDLARPGVSPPLHTQHICEICRQLLYTVHVCSVIIRVLGITSCSIEAAARSVFFAFRRRAQIFLLYLQ